jgi:group I intron endonuclease
MRYIYVLTNLINGKNYIGQTKNIKKRWFPSGYKKCTAIGRAIEKYGWDNFKKEIIVEGDFTEEEINEYEKYYISNYRLGKKAEYNILGGGHIGNPYKYMNEEDLLEYKQKLRNARLGKRLSIETREKISKKLLGQKRSEGFKAEMRFLQKKLKEEGRDKHDSTKLERKVICLETGEIFDSIMKASKKKNINFKNISATCLNKRRVAGGFHWSFYNKEKTDYIMKEKNESQKKKVLCIETNEIFSSLTEAMKVTGIKKISEVCLGKRNIAGGKHWEYI